MSTQARKGVRNLLREKNVPNAFSHPEKDPKKVQLGNRIRELREESALSREQLAAAAGVSVRGVIQWELGEREPGWFNMLALAEALGVKCDAFTQAPADLPPPKPGRPRKASANAEATETPTTTATKGKGQK